MIKIIYQKSGFYKLALLMLFSCCTYHSLFAQEKVNISAGLGIPELINLGVRFQYEKNQIGMSLGFLNSDGAGMFTLITTILEGYPNFPHPFPGMQNLD